MEKILMFVFELFFLTYKLIQVLTRYLLGKIFPTWEDDIG